MANLYQIHADIERIMETGLVIDMETGEVTENDAEKALAELQLSEEEKLENTALFIKNITSDIQSLKAEEQALNQRRQAKERKAAWAKQYLTDFMQLAKRNKFESPRCALSFRSSTKLDIKNEAALKEYAKVDDSILRYKEPEIDKKAVTKLLKDGLVLPGVELASSTNLQIK
jgi:hypothetical protein